MKIEYQSTRAVSIGFFGKNNEWKAYIIPDDPIKTPNLHIKNVTPGDGKYEVSFDLLHGHLKQTPYNKKFKDDLGLHLDLFMERSGNHFTSYYEKSLRLWNHNNPLKIDDSLINVLVHDDPIIYFRVVKEQSGLPMDVFLPDGDDYKQYELPLWIYMDACLPERYYELAWVPIIVSDSPQITQKKCMMNVSDAELQRVFLWIRKNKQLIVALSEGMTSNVDLLNAIRNR